MKLVDKNPFVTIEITDTTYNAIATEGYNLTVSKQGVNIKASSAAGAFYGLQALAQLARNGKELPVTTIKDEPRFPYREGAVLTGPTPYSSVSPAQSALPPASKFEPLAKSSYCWPPPAGVAAGIRLSSNSIWKTNPSCRRQG